MSGFYEYNNGRRNKGLEDYKERLSEEHAQLSERIERLRLYLNSKRANREFTNSIELLGRQYNLMMEYRDILEQRAFLLGYKLDAFDKVRNE